MGYNTNAIGHIEVQPPLSLPEQRYLTAFGQTRRYDRPGGPYEIADNPAIEHQRETSLPTEVVNSIAPGQPGYWCDWSRSITSSTVSWRAVAPTPESPGCDHIASVR